MYAIINKNGRYRLNNKEGFMDISKQLDEIIELLKGSGLSDYIAIFSVFVAVIALIVNIAANRRNHRQYI